eukprot:Platyproteum_vivax@DN12123_c0_g1_i1.p1
MKFKCVWLKNALSLVESVVSSFEKISKGWDKNNVTNINIKASTETLICCLRGPHSDDCQIWMSLAKQNCFEEYVCESKRANNEIILSLQPAALAEVLTQAKDCEKATFKLSKKEGRAVISAELRFPGLGGPVYAIHDIYVDVLQGSMADEVAEPSLVKPAFSLEWPQLRTIRHVVDRMRTIHAENVELEMITGEDESSGELTLHFITSEVNVKSTFNKLPVCEDSEGSKEALKGTLKLKLLQTVMHLSLVTTESTLGTLVADKALILYLIFPHSCGHVVCFIPVLN